jgi:hypothetical protein
MKAHHRISIAAAVAAALASCTTSSTPYYYDPYYGYYGVAYDDYYYDAAMVGGYYYYPYPTYYSYALRPRAVPSTSVVPPAVRLLLRRWNATVDPGCIVATSTADNDKDGIDVESKLTFRCDSSPAGGRGSVSGTVTVRDLDDGVTDAGYSLQFEAFAIRNVSATGAVTARVVDGTESIRKTNRQLTVERDIVEQATDTYPDGVERRAKLETKTLGTFAPELVEDAPVTKGTVTLSGEGRFTGPDGVVLTLTRQTDPTLHWNADCLREPGNSGYDAGAIVYRSSQGRQTRIVHEGCSSATVTNSTIP